MPVAEQWNGVVVGLAHFSTVHAGQGAPGSGVGNDGLVNLELEAVSVDVVARPGDVGGDFNVLYLVTPDRNDTIRVESRSDPRCGHRPGVVAQQLRITNGRQRTGKRHSIGQSPVVADLTSPVPHHQPRSASRLRIDV